MPRFPRIGGLVALTMTAALLTTPAADAHDAGNEKVTPVLRMPLPDAPGKQMTLAVVAYEPGQASAAHLHPGSVFAYVLEGEIASQLDGQPERVFKAGESWYEPPRTPHLVSRNASAQKPAKLLAILLNDVGEPLKVPLER